MARKLNSRSAVYFGTRRYEMTNLPGSIIFIIDPEPWAVAPKPSRPDPSHFQARGWLNDRPTPIFLIFQLLDAGHRQGKRLDRVRFLVCSSSFSFRPAHLIIPPTSYYHEPRGVRDWGTGREV